MNLVVRPNLAGLRDIASFRRIDAGDDADALTVLRVLSDRGINPILPKHRGRVNFARPFGIGILEFLAFGRIAIVPPNLFDIRSVAFLDWFGIKGFFNDTATPE